MSSSPLHIPYLGEHISGPFGRSYRNTPLQVVQFSSLSWHYGFGLHTLKNYEQHLFPLIGDRVGLLVPEVIGAEVTGGLVGLFVGVTFGIIVGLFD